MHAREEGREAGLQVQARTERSSRLEGSAARASSTAASDSFCSATCCSNCRSMDASSSPSSPAMDGKRGKPRRRGFRRWSEPTGLKRRSNARSSKLRYLEIVAVGSIFAGPDAISSPLMAGSLMHSSTIHNRVNKPTYPLTYLTSYLMAGLHEVYVAPPSPPILRQ